MAKFEFLYNTALKNERNGIDRYSIITTFNDTFYGLRDAETQSPLGSIAYKERRGIAGEKRYIHALATEIAKVLATSSWCEVFGLSFEETMDLDYSQWVLMRDIIMELDKSRGVDMPPDGS